MWLQFIGYIRTNAAKRMREAEEMMAEEENCSEDAVLEDAPKIAAAAERWLNEGKHLHNGITIKTAAEEMDVSKCKLTAWLKQTEYEQFAGWITHHRIQAAKQMLKEHSDWSNEAIAQACGFNTRSYFQTVFKKEVGMTPTEYQEGEKVR
jgi:AraC-like DNA-binding protein